MGWDSFGENSEGEEVRAYFTSSAKAIFAFSFFTVPLWAIELYFCQKNYRQGYYYLYDRIEEGTLGARCNLIYGCYFLPYFIFCFQN